MNKFLKEFKMI